MRKRKLVVIGNGMAGVRCVEEILNKSAEAFDITIFGKEIHPNYNRILLSKVLQGSTTIESIMLNDWDWYQENGITFYKNEMVTDINTDEKWVRSSERLVNYDELIIATGSNPFILPIPGVEKVGVTAFRTIDDCEKIIDASKHYKKAMVIGGGLLGLEAARGLLDLGMEVTVVHLAETLMERQLDQTAAKMLQKELEKQGMHFLLSKSSAEITGETRVDGIRFTDGSWCETDLVVMAVGVRPNIQVAANTAIEVNRAIVVDDYMRTNIPNVYAVGECLEHRGIVYGLVAPLYEQGKVLASYLCGENSKGYEGSVLSTQLKISGVDVYSTGEFMGDDELQSIEFYDGIKNTYKKIVVRNQIIVGAVLFGNIEESTKLAGMIKRGASFTELEMDTEKNEQKDSFVATMPDHEVVCMCNGVSKGTIVQAICEQSLEGVDEVKACTKASSSCGGCRPMVTSILEYIQQNGRSSEAKKEAICACANVSHEEIIELVRQYPRETREEIMMRLEWADLAGCSICLPALDYYIGVHGISDHQQKERSYTSPGRMYGGVTSAEQLRVIADLVEKYNIPLVKLSEGPKLEFYGERDPYLTGIPSFGEKLQAVSTDAGIHFAKDAMMDSIKIGMRLEHSLESIEFPTSLTLAVSSSPHDEAMVKLKDAGLIGTPLGWEIVVKEERLFSGLSEEEAESLFKALIHLYRENAFYSETIAQWLERIGLIKVREEAFRQKENSRDEAFKQLAIR
ncbi:MAG TPA: nitrite reductase large subunit NirB [Ureibacillus sp.]|nr:nitrite reductase large subunit NirB [Ureibacillus sp.]